MQGLKFRLMTYAQFPRSPPEFAVRSNVWSKIAGEPLLYVSKNGTIFLRKQDRNRDVDTHIVSSGPGSGRPWHYP